MTGPEPGGWFAYSPLSDNAELTPEQLAFVEERSAEYREQEPAASVELLLTSLEPGQAEIHIQSPPEHPAVETIDAAIRELHTARRAFEDTD